MTKNNSRGNGSSHDILLVERDPDGVSAFIDSFKKTGATEEVHVVSNGSEALDFIHQRGAYEDVHRPNLILLDLDISETSGEEVLAEIKEQPKLRRIPVLVLTTSEKEEDIAKTYELNANAYLHKPNTSEEFITLAQAIENFWLNVAHLPPV